MTDNRKVIFVQCEDKDVMPLQKSLSRLGDTDYLFLLVHPTTKALSREDIIEYHRALGDALEATGTPVTRRPSAPETRKEALAAGKRKISS